MRLLIVVPLVVLAACSDQPTQEELELEQQRDIELVEKANNTLPPLEEVVPEAIGYADIERYDLFGAACSYAPGTSLGARVIAREADAFMKIGGDIQRFAADAGARELPLRTRSLYNGREFSLRLAITGEGEPSGEETVNYEGSITLFDPHGRVVYEGIGLAQCGS